MSNLTRTRQQADSLLSGPREEITNTITHALRQISADYQIRAKRAQYMKDPVLWARERIKTDLWSLQGDIAASLVEAKKTIVKSCHSSGKTYLGAVLACWWIDVHPPEETVVVSTAPTAYQVNKLLWEYIRKIHRNNNLSGTVSETAEWKSDDRDTVGMGRKPADTDMHGFQGVHRTYVLVIIDEACGVAQTIWTGVEAITTSETNRVLAIGNPDDPNTEFGRIFLHNDPSWKKFTISAYDTPRFTGEVVPLAVAQNLISKEWVEDKKISWGEGSARFRAKVTAEFPENSDENLFPTSVLLAAQDLSILPKSEVVGRLGVDVARFGKDKTTVVYNLDGLVEIVGSWEKVDTVETASRVHALALKLGVREVRVDATGIGAGVQDQLAQLSHGNYHVIGMVGSAASPDLRKWRNARAFWYDTLRAKMAAGKVSLPNFSSGIDAKDQGTSADQDAKTLFEELEGTRYKFANGAILIESKDEMRARGFKSPDYADALCYACADFDVEDPLAALQPGETRVVDPFEMLGSPDYIISPV